MNPELCLGQVMHRRLRPVVNAFVYPVFYCRLPLSRLEETANAVFSLNRWNLLSLSFSDHGARDGSHPLPWIRDLLARQGLVEADGEIVLQCFPRVLGFVFNPVSFWLAHDRAGGLRAVLAEVSNTFGERHSYLLHHADRRVIGDGDILSAVKVFHVSPFLPLVGGYRFRFAESGSVRRVNIDYGDADGDLLLTAISGRPQAWRTGTLLAALVRMPLLTFGVIARIHWQALKLWRKGVPFFKKPEAPLQELSS